MIEDNNNEEETIGREATKEEVQQFERTMSDKAADGSFDDSAKQGIAPNDPGTKEPEHPTSRPGYICTLDEDLAAEMDEVGRERQAMEDLSRLMKEQIMEASRAHHQHAKEVWAKIRERYNLKHPSLSIHRDDYYNLLTVELMQEEPDVGSDLLRQLLSGGRG